jgi:endo-1,4-beta-xylanase
VINGDRSNHERVCRAAKASMRFFGDRQMALRARGFAWLAARSRLDGARGAAHVKSMQLARAPLGCRDPPRRKTMTDSIDPVSEAPRAKVADGYNRYMRFLEASGASGPAAAAPTDSNSAAEAARLTSELLQKILTLTASVMKLIADQLKGQLSPGGAGGTGAPCPPGASGDPGQAPPGGQGARPPATPYGPPGGAGPGGGGPPLGHGGGASPLGPDATGGGDGSSLKQKAARHGMYMGTAVTDAEINDPAFTKKVKDQFGVVTPENAMKWSEIDSKGFAPGDKIVDWAQANDIKMRGHTLVWHNQAPDRLANMSPEQVKNEMNNHITDTVMHFGDKVPTWDVVNEAIKDGGGGFRDSVFSRAMGGPGFIDEAFKTARKANPNAELALNDYSVETKNAKSDTLYETVKSMKERGVPIDAVGMQAHVSAGDDLSSMAANIKRFTDLGVKVQITELDVKGGDAAAKAATTKDVWDAAVQGGASGMTFWGVSDRHSWIGNDPGLPFDQQMNLKGSVKEAIG